MQRYWQLQTSGTGAGLNSRGAAGTAETAASLLLLLLLLLQVQGAAQHTQTTCG